MGQTAAVAKTLPDDTTPDPDVLDALDPPGRHRTLLVLGVLGLAALLGGSTAAWALLGSAGATYETVAAVDGVLVQGVTAIGRLEPLDTVEVGSDLSGRLLVVSVDANDRVEVGQELARLDPESFENAVAKARAQVSSARAALTQARVDLASARRDADRATRLLAKGAATRAEADDAAFALQNREAAVASAVAGLEQAQASLETAEDDLADTVVVSPIAGVVTQRYVDPGQTVVSAMQATPLFEIASELTTMKAEVGVDEADIGGVREGQPATFTVSAWPDRRFEARVRSVAIAPEPEGTVVTYDAELRLDNAELVLRPGMTATAEIEVGRIDSGVLVPIEALSYLPADADAPAGQHVFVLSAGRPLARSVKVLGEDGERVSVTGELSAGDLVIVDDGGAR